MRYIECGVNNEFVSGAGQVIGAAGSHHDVALRITFGGMWDGLSMYVTFRDALGENPTVVQILPTDLVLGTERTYDVVVPAAPKAKQGKAMVTVQGYTVVGGTQEANATNTATAYFIVLPSDYTLADDESIDATIAQQLQSEIDEIGETITDAREAAQDAEAWAVGQIEGTDVEDTDPRYHNNSKYYAQQADEYATDAAAEAEAAEAWATGGTEGTPSATNNAKHYSEQAGSSATTASTKAGEASDSATAALGSQTAAAASATEAESYAKGGTSSRAGEDIDNAKYYKEEAASSATIATNKASDASDSATTASGSATTATAKATLAESWAVGGTSSRSGEDTNNAKYYSEQASGSATTASNKASDASDSAAAASGSATTATAKATLAESWAVGGTNTRTGEDTNNAKYWSEVAQQAAGGGVSSFNGRSGAVTPKSGDYTAAMVGADASGAAAEVQENLTTHANNTTIHITAAERTEWNAKANFPAGGTEGQILIKTSNGTEWGDAPIGFAPQVIVTAPTGSTVTLTSGATTLTATESGGTWTFDIPNYGTWTATATLGGQMAIGNVSVMEVKQYTILLTSLIPVDLNDATWAQISEVSAAGLGDDYWDVGDTKSVALSGTCGTLSLSTTLYCYILGFDHNSAKEGTGITFGTWKTAAIGGVDVCLVDANYITNKSDGTKAFNLNHWGGSSYPYNTNYGGWKGCDARYDILGSTKTAPSGYGSTPTTSRVGYDAPTDTATSPVANTLMSCLPSALRAVMKPITKYTDNYGNSSNVAEHVTTSVDYLPLLAEYEIFGARSDANQYEQNNQAQYTYFASGNSKVKYRHSSTGSDAFWWERSPCSYEADDFCGVHTGGAYHRDSRGPFGLAPAFMV